MRFFELLSLQHVALFFFPSLIFILLLAAALGFVTLRTRSSEQRKRRVTHVFPGGIEERDGPVPLAVLLLIAGFFLWAVVYALMHALSGAPV